MYLVSTQGVLVFSAIDKNNEFHPVKDSFEDFKPSGLTDMSRDGQLMVDVMSVKQYQEGLNLVNKYQIRKYNGTDAVSCELLDHKKEKVKFFGKQNHIIELKSTNDGQSQLSIHDF